MLLLDLQSVLPLLQLVCLCVHMVVECCVVCAGIPVVLFIIMSAQPLFPKQSVRAAGGASAKLTAVQASVWSSLARRCEVIGSQISSVEGITSSLSNWFPL